MPDFNTYSSLSSYNAVQQELQSRTTIKAVPPVGPTIVPDFGTVGYTALTKAIVQPGSYFNLTNAYSRGAYHCGLLNQTL
jgi:hypothetical protein